MGRATKIDWADATWNPVTGCLHGCEYCYAKRIAERFGSHFDKAPGIKGDVFSIKEKPVVDGKFLPYPFDFAPTFHKYTLDVPQEWRRPKTVFVCSMADLFGKWVQDSWIKQVFEACAKAPQHRYMFLTKNPARYIQLGEKGILPKGDNYWFGSSVTSPEMPFWWSDEHNSFASIEPIMEPFDYKKVAWHEDKPKWIIVGAETGNRSKKVVPEKDWITGIIEGCREHNVPLFMKESLRELMGEDFIQQFPWE